MLASLREPQSPGLKMVNNFFSSIRTLYMQIAFQYPEETLVFSCKNSSVQRAWLVLGKFAKWILILLKLHTCTPMSLDCITSIIYCLRYRLWFGTEVHIEPLKKMNENWKLHMFWYSYTYFLSVYIYSRVKPCSYNHRLNKINKTKQHLAA